MHETVNECVLEVTMIKVGVVWTAHVQCSPFHPVKSSENLLFVENLVEDVSARKGHKGILFYRKLHETGVLSQPPTEASMAPVGLAVGLLDVMAGGTRDRPWAIIVDRSNVLHVSGGTG
jgi:hypothetical protein